MHISRYQRQIGVIVLSTTGFWRDVMDFHISHQQGLFADCTFSALSDIKGNAVVVQLGTLPLYGVFHELLQDEVGEHIDPMLNERLLSILSTKENVNLQTLGFTADVSQGYQAIITPINIAGERLGTLFLYRKESMYEIDDIILSEYGTTVVGLEMLRSVNEESAEETRKEQIVQSAISTLSFSELEAIIHIFDELNGMEGILVASKIADRVGITRSVIVNALRKFESAGVIESRSSGMKGTYIKVVNDYVFKELDKIKKEKMN